jgi:hypothetical protein
VIEATGCVLPGDASTEDEHEDGEEAHAEAGLDHG